MISVKEKPKEKEKEKEKKAAVAEATIFYYGISVPCSLFFVRLVLLPQ